MMTNFSSTPPSPIGAEQENQTMDNGTLNSSNCFWHFEEDIKLTVIASFIYFVCAVGLLGNGAVIWLLGFCMKRTPVTTYILNLAVADFGVLLFVTSLPVFVTLKSSCETIFLLLFGVAMLLFHVFFSISQFLLTVISIDRCVSLLFPIWYRCHRPENLSTALCAITWILCFLVHGIGSTLIGTGNTLNFSRASDTFNAFLVNSVVCLPLITVSTLILFVRFCFKSQQHKRGKLLMAILMTLFFFLFLAFPLNVLYIMLLQPHEDKVFITEHIFCVGHLCTSLNSCVNPLIYFFIGRTKKKSVCSENLKLILQRVFKQEDEVYGEELQPPAQLQEPLSLHTTGAPTNLGMPILLTPLDRNTA